MVTRRFGRVRAAPGAALAMALFATPAAAVDVTVGGNTYDITFPGFGRSFLDDETAIRGTPWWGDRTLALDVARAYFDQIGTGGAPFTTNADPNTQLWFAYGDPDAGRVRYFALSEDTTTFDPNDVFPADNFIFEGDASQTLRPANATFAILGAPAVPVPEINAGSLAQALFVLLALHLWVRGRRRGRA